MTMYVNPMQSHSPSLHRLIAMPFEWSIWKEATLFLVQLIVVGDDVEDTLASLFTTLLEYFVDVL